ncbi:hypothetical protein EW146_g3421 [Bondarzewia mesenterica]|uniref:Mid2 domain-containing protein n=1 Tax=Bondarzewia mesenterica TaxID=1095465 RepID=A0A4S4LXJ9_9AGAM|nr:hypothetical protein EW146_g3421 [Bondarzewia mesenterica]
MRPKPKAILIAVALQVVSGSVLVAAEPQRSDYASRTGPALARKRQLGGLFDGFDELETSQQHHHEEQTTAAPTRTSVETTRAREETVSEGLFKTIEKLLTSEEDSVRTVTVITATAAAASAGVSSFATSVPSSTSVARATSSTLASASPSPNRFGPLTSATNPPPSSPSPSSLGASDVVPPKAPSTDWKVIGVAVIAVSVVGAAILAVVFFDHWWRFLKDLASCGWARGRGDLGEEQLVPDWDKRSWEYQVGGAGTGTGTGVEAGDRVPSFGSPPAEWGAGTTSVVGAGYAGLGAGGGRNRALARAASRRMDVSTKSSLQGTEDPFEMQEAHPSDLGPSGQARASPAPFASAVPVRPSPLAREWHPENETDAETPAVVPMKRSDTSKSFVTEDAYGGLA